MFQGSLVALVTPMTAAGELDKKGLRHLIKFHYEAGTQGIVVNGTTGEAPTLTEQERNELLEISLEGANGKIPIIMGTGTNSTRESIHQTKMAENIGADACMVVTPYYNKPTQEGLYQHYQQIAESVSLPLILYNVTSRTACDLQPETVQKLSTIRNIVGLKEASSDLSRGRKLVDLCPPTFSLLSGDDASALAFMLQGGRGVVSVTANVVPQLMNEMCQAALSGNIHRAGTLNTRLMPLHKQLFVETNPIPVKWVLKELGLIEEGIRLPLTTLSQANQFVVKEAMKESGVLN